MLGLSTDKEENSRSSLFFGRKKKKPAEEKKTTKETIQFREDASSPVSDFKTVSLLEGIPFDVNSVDFDEYVRWLSCNAKKSSAIPLVNCIRSNLFVSEAIKNATLKYNNGDFKANFAMDEQKRLDSMIPTSMEVQIF